MNPLAHMIIAATAMTVGCVGQDLYRNEKKRVPFENVDLLVEPVQSAAELAPALEEAPESPGATEALDSLVDAYARLDQPLLEREGFAVANAPEPSRSEAPHRSVL